jgi:hypothetical protein
MLAKEILSQHGQSAATQASLGLVFQFLVLDNDEHGDDVEKLDDATTIACFTGARCADSTALVLICT